MNTGRMKLMFGLTFIRIRLLSVRPIRSSVSLRMNRSGAFLIRWCESRRRFNFLIGFLPRASELRRFMLRVVFVFIRRVLKSRGMILRVVRLTLVGQKKRRLQIIPLLILIIGLTACRRLELIIVITTLT